MTPQSEGAEALVFVRLHPEIVVHPHSEIVVHPHPEIADLLRRAHHTLVLHLQLGSVDAMTLVLLHPHPAAVVL
jgi:hypothetical protein